MDFENEEVRKLKKKIEEARTILNQRISKDKNEVLDEEIVKLSQRLDDLLMEYIRKFRK